MDMFKFDIFLTLPNHMCFAAPLPCFAAVLKAQLPATQHYNWYDP